MKSHLLFIPVALLVGTLLVHGQGAFIYDQQSSTNEGALPYGAGVVIQQIASPYGQSFTPTLSAVDFIRLKLNDNDPNNSLSATLRVNLRTNSINGSILASTASVSLTNGFTGVVNFFFSSSLSLTPGVVYYFQPVVQSGDLWNLEAGEYNYPGGSVFVGGFAATASDYWFREGIVPEPSAGLLFLFGSGVVAWCHRKKRNNG
jgi:hypothetical protein